MKLMTGCTSPAVAEMLAMLTCGVSMYPDKQLVHRRTPH